MQRMQVFGLSLRFYRVSDSSVREGIVVIGIRDKVVTYFSQCLEYKVDLIDGSDNNIVFIFIKFQDGVFFSRFFCFLGIIYIFWGYGERRQMFFVDIGYLGGIFIGGGIVVSFGILYF